MKNCILLIVGLIFFGTIFSQQNVFSISGASTGNWWDGSNPWYYQTWNNSQERPDLWPAGFRNDVFIGHNSNNPMNINGAFFQLRDLNIEQSVGIQRTYNASFGGGLSFSKGCYVQTTFTQTFNTPIGVDAASVDFQNQASGGLTVFTQDFYLNSNNARFDDIGNVRIDGIVQGTGGTIQKFGSGTLTLTANNTYTGSTTLQAGVLRFNPAVTSGTHSSPIVLNGGTISTSGITSGRSVTSSSTLQLTANSTFALHANSHQFNFASSNGITWTPGAQLSITGWTGTAGASGTNGRIFIGNSASGLTDSQLSQITFSGFTGKGMLLPSGELVPRLLIFRSKQTGDWNVISTWEISRDGGASWEDATYTPTNSDGAIEIRNGHVLSITASVSVDQITILSGGLLVLTGGTLTIANGVGDDFIIQGTYQRTSSSTTMSISSGASVVCANGGKYTHSVAGGSLPSITWQDGSLLLIENSISSNLNQSFWNVHKTGGNSTTLSADNTSRTMLVRNNFEQTGGNFYLKNGGTTGGTHSIRVRGNLIHSGGGFNWNSSQIDNTSITSIFIETDFIISGTASWGGYVSATQCASGVFFDGTTSQTFSTSLLNASGALRDRFYFKTTGGPTELNESYTGTSEQWTISGICGSVSGYTPWPTSGGILQNLTIANSSVQGVNLRHNRLVNNQLVLTDGLLNSGNCNAGTTSTTLLSLSDNATSAGGSSTSYVNGVMRKIGNDAFTFPVGDIQVFAPIGISAPANVTDEFGACYTTGNPRIAFGTAYSSGIDHVSACEYWHLNRISGSSTVQVDLTWDTRSCGVTNMSELLVCRWNGSSWINHGNSATAGTLTSGTITSTGVSAFSPFTLGSTTINNPLPVDLISFQVSCDQSTVNLEWTTASELNASHYIVQTSRDGVLWMDLAQVNAVGNSNIETNYLYSDVYHGYLVYYRLVQVDFDGNQEIFGPISSLCENKQDYIKLFPNPISDQGTIVLVSSDNYSNSELVVTDLGGRVVWSKLINLSSGVTSIPSNFLNFKTGVYVIRLVGYEDTFIPLKWIKN
jgi:autotransporter-associated beta strand protein